MNSSKKIFDGLIWTYIKTILSSVYGFISVPILLVYFGRDEYGLISLALSLNVYLQLMDMGFSGTTVRYFSNWLAKKDYKKVKYLFSTTLFFLTVIGLANAVILLILSYFCQHLFSLTNYQTQIMRELIYILSLNAVISWLTSVFDQLIRANECVMWLQKRALIPILCQFLILFVTVFFKLSISSYFFLITFSYVLIIPVTLKKVRAILPEVSFIPKFNGPIFREIIVYSLSVFSFSIFQSSMLNLRPVILGIQSDLGDVTDYKILNGITSIVLMVSGCFFGVLLPSSSKVVAEKNIEAQNMLAYQGTKYITILLSFFIFGGITIGAHLLELYVGSSYVHLTIWLSIWLFSLFIQHNQAISTLIFSHTNLKPIAYMSAFSAIVGLIACWYLTPILGLGGVVIGYLLYVICQLLFYYLYYWRKYLGINSRKVFISSFLPPVILGGFVCLFIQILFQNLNYNAWICFFVKGIFYAVTFVCLAYFFILNKVDKSFFRNLIIRK